MVDFLRPRLWHANPPIFPLQHLTLHRPPPIRMGRPPTGIIPRPVTAVAQRAHRTAPGPRLDQRRDPQRQVQHPHVRPHPPHLYLLDAFDFLQVVEVLLDGPPIEGRRTISSPLACVIAADGERLLAAIEAVTDQPWLTQISSVMTLRHVWAEQYTGEPGQLRWREVKDMPSPAELISSPYDIEARYSTKRNVERVGYNVHLTETCDEQMPRLIVNVETTPATTPDDNMIKVVHASLEERDLLPDEHPAATSLGSVEGQSGMQSGRKGSHAPRTGGTTQQRYKNDHRTGLAIQDSPIVVSELAVRSQVRGGQPD